MSLKRRQSEFLTGLLLVSAVLLIFGRTAGFEFVDYDDSRNIVQNADVNMGLSLRSFCWAFTDSRELADYNPITWLSHMLNCEIFGLAPGGHHLTNALLHAVNSVLLFLVFRSMTGTLGRSAFVAFIFAVHPLRVESVAWITERKDVLCGLFSILAIGAYARYAARTGSATRYLLVVLAVAGALLSKSMAVTLPFVFLLLDYWPLGRMGARRHETLNSSFSGKTDVIAGPTRPPVRLLTEKIPLFMMSAIVGLMAYVFNKDVGAVSSLENIGLPARINNALVSYAAYIWKMIWPCNLAVFYPHPGNSLPVWKILGSVSLLGTITGVAVRYARRRPWLIMGWLWYLGTLVPVIGIVQVGKQAMADRYTYLTQIGLAIIIAWGAAALSGRVSERSFRRPILAAASTLVIAALIACSWRQTSHWRNSMTLFTRALAATSGNEVAHNGVGNALLDLGRVQEAIRHYRKALDICPEFAPAHNNLGNALYKIGRIQEAIPHYGKAIELGPAPALAHNGLGNALLALGKVDQAAEHFRKAADIDPKYASAHYNLGNCLVKLGKTEEAMDHFMKTVAINPRHDFARNSLGNCLMSLGQFEEAIEQYRKAVEINPGNHAARHNLARALNRQ